MKAGLIIYSFLCLLGGLIVLQSTGSPTLLLGPFAGLLVYAACCTSRGFAPELVRGLACILILAQSAWTLGNGIENILLVMLHVPIFVAATQCLWELRNPPDERNKRRPQLRVTVFSAGFVACAAVAFVLLLNAEGFRLSLMHRQIAAGLFLVLGLVTWEVCRIPRMKPGVSTDTLPVVGILLRLAVAGLLGLLLMFACVDLLPRVAEGLIHFSPHWKIRGVALNQAIDNAPKPKLANAAKTTTDPKGTAKSSGNSLEGPEGSLDGEAELPSEGKFDPPDSLRFGVKFKEKEEGLQLEKQQLLYFRTLAMGHFRNGKWLPNDAKGFWIDDKEDGLQDQRVNLIRGVTTGKGYTVYLLDADGSHLPHLAGIQQFSLPKVYALPDEWFQIEPYGQIRYDAISQPQLFQFQDIDSLRVGTPGDVYTEPCEQLLSEKLKPLAKEIFGLKKLPGDKIRNLADWLSKNVQYSTDIHNPKQLPAIENFLFGERKGFCEHYATAATLLLRLADVPCRIAFGYLGGVYEPDNQTHLFGRRDSHAWVEVYFKDVGWVICDLTPPQPHTENRDNLIAGGGNGVKVNFGSFDRVDEVIEKAKAAAALTVPDLTLLEKIQRSVTDNSTTLGIATFAIILAVTLWQWWKNRLSKEGDEEKKAARKTAELLKQPEYFQEFTKMCKEFGHNHTPDQTLREFEKHLRDVKFYHDEFGQMTDYHYATRYEDRRPDTSRENGWISFIRDYARQRRQLQKENQQLT